MRWILSFLFAAFVGALFWVFLSGPRLGLFYDFLLRQRPATPISRELLIIDSSMPGLEFGEDILEPLAASSLLYTMTELGAEALIIQVPILGLSIGGAASEAEILDRFDEEFSILSRNIRNLFDAIRTGSIAPMDSGRYVGELVELSEMGKERLVYALVRRDEEGVISMERAAALFGNARRPGDLMVQLIRSADPAEGSRSALLAEMGEYSRIRPDRDGVLRRIAPIITVPVISDYGTGEKKLEHIIYGALKTRYESYGIVYIERSFFGIEALPMRPMPVLALRSSDGETDRIIPLDRNGAVIFQVPGTGQIFRRGDAYDPGSDFRRISILDFLAYDEADRNLRRLLGEAEALGIYQGIAGENHPVILYDFALSLRDEGNKQLWIETRNRYFTSLKNFLSGPSEMNLVRGFEEIIVAEPENLRFLEMRDELIQTFAAIRLQFDELWKIRQNLENALAGSFCILGRGTDVEASALLANSLLTGSFITPGADLYLLLAALLFAFFICFFIKSKTPISALGIGVLSTIIIGAGFSLIFIFFGIWFDPLVPVAACFAGTLSSFAWAFIAKLRYSRRFRLAYGPFISRSCLKRVTRAGKPLPSALVKVRAALIAIKQSGGPAVAGVTSGDSLLSRASAMETLKFQEKAADFVRKAGGTITGTEGEIVTACFGSPLERVCFTGKRKTSPYEDNILAKAAPALRAVDFVSDIVHRPECESWHFGIDIGECSFAWTEVSGYFALGAPVQKAKLLSRLAGRHKSRVVISNALTESLPDLTMKKLDVLKSKDGVGEEPYYRLSV